MAMCMRDGTEARSTRRSQFAASHSAAAPSGPLSSATGSLCLSMGSDLRPARRPACSKQQRSPSINTVQGSAHKEADGAFSATATPRRQRARSRGKGRTAETSTTPPAPPDRSVSAYRCNLPAAAPCRLHARNYSLQLFLLACKRGPKATPSKPPKYAAPSKETEGNRQMRGSFCVAVSASYPLTRCCRPRRRSWGPTTQPASSQSSSRLHRRGVRPRGPRR